MLEDVTDVLRLRETAKGGYRTLWWICLVVLVITDTECVYALVYVVAMWMSVGASVSLWLTVVSSSVLLSCLSWLFSLLSISSSSQLPRADEVVSVQGSAHHRVDAGEEAGRGNQPHK